MRAIFLIMSTMLAFVFLAGGALGIFNYMVGNELYEDQAYEQLLSITESKAERVRDFLDNRKADAVFLAESEDVRSIFDEELVKDVELMQGKIKSIAKGAAEDIERYILDHPDMALEDLQGDAVFQSIAVQRVGETGYTYVNSMREGVLYFHPDPNARGKSYHAWKDVFPNIWKYNEEIAQSDPCRDSYGFYDWEDINGNIREKFTYHSCIGIKSSDNYSFYVGASTYLDEYGGSIQLASDLDLEFKSFQESKEYSDLIFINPEGDVIWTAEENNELGTNLVSGIYSESLLANVFNKVKMDLDVGISDSEAYGPGGKLNIFVTAPVINNVSGEMKLKGVIALQLDNEKIAELIKIDVRLGDVGEVYLVNRDGRHISPLKFNEIEHMEREHLVDSERIGACFEDYNNYYLALRGERVDKVEKFGTYLNYADPPKKVLGAHTYILESGWCVIAEMGSEYFSSIIPNLNMIIISIAGVLFLFLLIVSLVIDGFFKIEKEGVK